MPTNITIKSGGRFYDTQIFMQEQDGQDPGRAIPGSDLQKVQLYFEPDVSQVAIEIKYVQDGTIKRWNGVNEGDHLAFSLEAEADGTLYAIQATSTELEVKAGMNRETLSPLFVGGTMVLEIVANGWALQLNKYFDMMPKQA